MIVSQRGFSIPVLSSFTSFMFTVLKNIFYVSNIHILCDILLNAYIFYLANTGHVFTLMCEKCVELLHTSIINGMDSHKFILVNRRD